MRDAFGAPSPTASPDEPDCGPAARHRVIVTGLGLGMIGVAVGAAAVTRGRRRERRRRLVTSSG
jgi:hypothetical protein